LEEEERIYSIPNAEDVVNPSPEEDGMIWFSNFLSAFSNF
jgi:hypothetical protein